MTGILPLANKQNWALHRKIQAVLIVHLIMALGGISLGIVVSDHLM